MDSMTPTEFIAVVNQTLEYAYSSVTIVGEVASFKVNQGKWVFFDVKDEESSISCFMTLFQLRQPLEDGMKVIVRGVPKLTKWGKFSFTVTAVQPVGEGSLKKAFELLKKKLSDEGLFDETKKRELPKYLTKLGVISSTQAAGYADFIKIINARWCGMKIQVAHTQVQGLDAPDQIIRALNYFNERGEVEAIAIIRGGGSADDLSCFNDEQLVRAVASSKIPVITGIGHEVDESLCDLAADVRASTPSNAAEILTLDKEAVKFNINMRIDTLDSVIYNRADAEKKAVNEKLTQAMKIIGIKIIDYRKQISARIKTLSALNPERVLRQGYAILKGEINPGSVVNITTFDKIINAEVKEIHEREKNH
ncbi:exodeoxyribonuclease VII large subunit [Candidatus Saccharibacteria bacterium]|nr:exodeoxyribonuclease VII large subunit [Candidatus Saccharibacteria bacterium]